MQETINGCRVFYQIRPNPVPDAPRVLLLHGWGCDHTVFAPVENALAEGATIVTLDFPGHGRSGEPPGKLLASRAEQFHGVRTGIPGRSPQDSPVQNPRFPVKHGRNQLGSAGFKAKNRFIHYSIRTNQSPPVPSLKLPSFQADSLTLAGSSRQKDTPGQRK